MRWYLHSPNHLKAQLSTVVRRETKRCSRQDPEHVQVCEELAMKADILVDGFRPGVMSSSDSTSELMRKIGTIYCAITGFGLTGPDANKGHDINYVARAGVLATNGSEDIPHVIGVQVADFGGAMVAVAGISAALYQREKTQKGSVVDVSLTESAMAFNAINQGAVHGGHEHRRGHELLDGSRPCYRVYRCKEGFLLSVRLSPNSGALSYKLLVILNYWIVVLIPASRVLRQSKRFRHY